MKFRVSKMCANLISYLNFMHEWLGGYGGDAH